MGRDVLLQSASASFDDERVAARPVVAIAGEEADSIAVAQYYVLARLPYLPSCASYNS